MKKILLVDANLLLFRSFYAAYAISKNSNNMTSHFFMNSLLEIIKEKDPDYLLLAFDAHARTIRHDVFNQYKAGRTKPPDEIYHQKQIILKILKSMNIKHYEIPGDEADDIIATVCNKFKNNNYVFILSEDRDLMQLVDLNVAMIVKNKNKNVNKKYQIINLDNFYEIFHYFPNQVIDFKAIAGDSSDNLPGIKGIGTKTAINLLSRFKTLEGIYENLDKLSLKQQQAFLQYREFSLMSKKLATLNKDVNLNINLEDILFNKLDILKEQVLETLDEYNLKKLQELIKKIN